MFCCASCGYAAQFCTGRPIEEDIQRDLPLLLEGPCGPTQLPSSVFGGSRTMSTARRFSKILACRTSLLSMSRVSVRKDHLSHPDAGPAMMSAAGQFLPEPSSDPMSQPKSFCFYVWLLGAYSHFRSEGSLSGGLLF